MSLTPAEKAAGRAFRTAAQALLGTLNTLNDPPTATMPPFGRVYRHECQASRGRSTGLGLKEKTLESPESDAAPAGRFTFTYVEGRCPACDFTVRSSTGRFQVVPNKEDE